MDSEKPTKVQVSDVLGPEECAKLDALLDHIYEYGTIAEGISKRVIELALSIRKKERERCIKACNMTVYGRVGSATMRQVVDWCVDEINGKGVVKHEQQKLF